MNPETPALTLDKAIIMDALRQVVDPEIGCNIVDLGLIYDVIIEGPDIYVAMTLTTQGCPMHESLTYGVRMALLQLPGVEEVEVNIVWDPPWTPAMMSEAGRQATGLL